jgi:hypothetical protein
MYWTSLQLLDHLVGASEQGRNVQPRCLGGVKLENKIAQLEHAYVRPRHQREAM